MSPRIGELFAGYGGLGLGVQQVYGGEVAWVSEFDKGPSKILAHRFPGVPNHGDITTIKWTPDCPTCGEALALYWNDDMPEGRGYYCPTDGWFDLAIRFDDPEAVRIPEPVEILTGGSPCQDLSHAGRRAGMTEGTRSNLWVAMREAIAQLRPPMVVWENVAGALSARAESESDRGGCNEPCVCGGSDRRGGLHPSRGQQDDLPSQGHDRDGRGGSSDADRAVTRVGREPVSAATGDGSLGSSLDVAYGRTGSGAVADINPALPAIEGGASRGGTGGSRGLGEPGSHVRRQAEAMDAGGTGRVRAPQAAIACSQCQGAACEECGGCVDAARNRQMEPGAGPLGDRPDRPSLRALGRVLGDLSTLGYDASWHALRAADVGAPHGRLRVFVVATDTQGDQGRIGNRDSAAPTLAGGLRRGAGRTSATGEANGGRASTDAAGRGLLPTPRATDGTKGGPNQRGSSGDLMLPSAVAQLLPSPSARDWRDGGGTGANVEEKAYLGRVAWRLGDMHTPALLPTPRVKNNENRQSEGYGGEDGNFYGLLQNPERWGSYAAAVARWEAILERPAPGPTLTNKRGNQQLSPAFVEWMMGLPAGWVTDVPGITRNEALKALGNGVVPQQAAEALRVMAAWQVAA